MQLGMVGLGRMGLNMAVRLLRRGHQVVGTARGAEAFPTLEREGGKATRDLAGLVHTLATPRTVWVMVPAGAPTQSVLDELRGSLAPGDLVVDGGNARYTDSVARAQAFAVREIGFVDAGTSGGVWGLEKGYCMMVGGEPGDVARLAPVLRDLAPPDGFLHTGPAGSGHFCKMVHNGIEYGMLQAYGEGFEILARSAYTFDLPKVAHLWNQGSVVRSWLLELAERAFAKDARLEGIRGYVEDSGEGRWTVQEAIDLNIPAPVLTLSLLARFASRQDQSFSAKVIAALRNEFGGHAVKKVE
ncbi:MAG TPA: decarboxylating 6-phosphogluconate dehydrogenase [Candidatus Polarisedimenticolaceae bacterium]|nr:decarboxylating 6-phosphogluconate dehydrogenase [Candidatus Polarisedimenticolaceae bacterium]